jgi:hypothetical protein
MAASVSWGNEVHRIMAALQHDSIQFDRSIVTVFQIQAPKTDSHDIEKRKAPSQRKAFSHRGIESHVVHKCNDGPRERGPICGVAKIGDKFPNLILMAGSN